MIERRVICALTVLLWILILFNLPVGFKSYVDEAFFVLGLHPEQDLGVQHSQFFQIARWFFRIFSIEPIVINSRIVTFALMISTLFFFSFASYRWLSKKQESFPPFYLYASLVFLYGTFIFFSAYEISLSFNHLHVFFATVLLSLYLLWDVTNQNTVRYILVFTSGNFAFLAVMNYFPAGILITLTILFLLLLKEAGRWKKVLFITLFYGIGIGSCSLIYNYFIYPVEDALNNIIASIKHPAFGTGGYDLLSYMKLGIEYAGKVISLFLGCCGVYFLYRSNRQNKVKWKLAVSFLLGLYLLLERKILLYNTAIIPVVLVCIVYCFSNPIPEIRWKNKPLRISIIQNLIFFLFPLIAVIGTNVDIEYKILYFSFIWILAFTIYLFRIRNRKIYRSLLYFMLGLTLYLNTWTYFKAFATVRGTFLNARYRVEDHRQFESIRLKQSQVEYFQQVDSLLKVHHFDPKQDKIFASDLDYATLLYLNTTNYGGLMHHIYNMPVYKDTFDSPENEPDYIIVLRSHRKQLMQTVVQNFNWNFPDDYTEYSLGKPDDGIPDMHYSGPRSLFVKNKKIK